MSGKNSRHTPSPSPSSPHPGNTVPSSKLPKFLQKQSNRDRSNSKSVIESPVPGHEGSTSGGGGPSPASASEAYAPTPAKTRKTSKFLSINKDKDDKRRASPDIQTPQPSTPTTPSIDHTQTHAGADADEAPVIVEPVSIPRPRTRSERPVSSAPEIHHTLYSSTSSTSRIGDLPTRLSGWFQHTFSTSSTDLSTLLAQQASSPKGKGPNALVTAAKHGKGHLDKAMRYLLDSDAVPDRSPDPIWLLGVQHAGYEPSAVPGVAGVAAQEKKRRGSGSPTTSFRSSTSSVASSTDTHALSQSTSSIGSTKHGKQQQQQDPAAHWPPVFYVDFTSRIWLTYRSQFPMPIKDGRLADLCGDNWEETASSPVGGGGRRAWPWGGEKTWSSDSGWGCMLRTGQSLLANALVHVHLSRDWRRPPQPVQTADYATYVEILTWFFDTPAPEAPFSVHRMALAGKELGTDVGQWFGPSVAAGAIRTLVNQFPESGLAVSVATDSTLYQSQVFAASHGDANYRSPRRQYTKSWGDRPVLLLLGIRLGIEGVNPIYYETIKRLYQFPQSVGIAGGRPSSSYYFVGSQADNLFYLDPHNPRPAIPLRPPAPDVVAAASAVREKERERERQSAASPESSDLEGRSGKKRQGKSGEQQQQQRPPATPQKDRRHQPQPQPQPVHQKGTPSVSSSRHSTHTRSSMSGGGSSSSSHPPESSSPPPSQHAPISPSPLQQQLSSSSADSERSYSTASTSTSTTSSSHHQHQHSRSPPPSYSAARPPPAGHGHGRWRSASHSQPGSPKVVIGSHPSRSPGEMDERELGGSGTGQPPVPLPPAPKHEDLDPLQMHYCNAYSGAELTTFHCERVRKMPMSGLDPSMLIGFLCVDERDWWDFRRRVGELPKTIFSVQEEPPTWPSDSDDNMGLESMSEPDDLDFDDDEDGLLGTSGDGEGEEGEDDVNDNDNDADEPFFDTQSASASSTSISQSQSHRNSQTGASYSDKGSKSEEVDTEDDPMGPVTPGPGTRFEFVGPGGDLKGRKPKGSGGDEEDEEEAGYGRVGGFEDEDDDDEEEEEGEGDDIEDDWVDPSLPTPLAPPPVPVKDVRDKEKDKERAREKERDRERREREKEKERERKHEKDKKKEKEPSPSPPSSSNVPPLTKSKSGSSSAAKHGSESKSRSSSSKSSSDKKKRQMPVPVPMVKFPHQRDRRHHSESPQGQGQGQEAYPFPVTPADDNGGGGSGRASGERSRQSSATRVMPKQPRMHTARARDGGRTQSGGVKGILPSEPGTGV